ncbi:uncharacterized protein N7477_006822 [Penicillium maclennaniae]|uniref:uncharacterized protein n=1 Tax=Penicillium maclennaniae TaxID=1343394 RepID=UPI00254048DB|nr:uncharacterized protein N7477_006822 [Penicillium maclennaniae]KAJ5668252.1 hypothetical protein N7477_006822 [Penicillium maclennaniae]
MSGQTGNIDLARLDAQMTELLEAFEDHPQMQPPVTHPTVYFLMDFVRNTQKELKGIDAEKYAAGDQAAREQVLEVVGRNQFTYVLLNDSSGKVSVMTGSDPNNPVDFGANIKAKARALTEGLA